MRDADGMMAGLRARFTPRQAASIKHDVLTMRLATDQESLDYSDRMASQDGGHGWFVYCLDAIAREANRG